MKYKKSEEYQEEVIKPQQRKTEQLLEYQRKLETAEWYEVTPEEQDEIHKWMIRVLDSGAEKQKYSPY